jgi:uncharacterized membrane protein
MASDFTQSAITIGVFSALSAAGGLLKIPSPVGSIALDSAPGYFVAAFYNPLLGAIVGTVGHLASAATAGFPLSYLHIYVAVLMFGWCFLFGAIARAGASFGWLILAVAAATLTNGIATPFLLALPPAPLGLHLNQALILLPFLVVASLINLIIAAAAAWAIVKFRPAS